MKKETLEKIREAFVKATQVPCRDNLELERCFLELLSQAKTPEEDIPRMDFFLSGLRSSISSREQTMDYIELCTDIMYVTVHIIIWTNEKHSEWLEGKDAGEGIDAIVFSRCKAVISEMLKMLEKADNLVPPIIDDLFGIRYVISNPENGIFLACILAQKIFNVLCCYSRKDRADFIEFIKENFNMSTQERIFRVLEIPFQLKEIRRTDSPDEFDLSKIKDWPKLLKYKVELPTDEDRKILENFVDFMKFYFDPKSNLYQSLHFVLVIPSSSEDMPGAKIEIQFRTENMDYYANNIIAKSHKGKVAQYKKYFRLTLLEIATSKIRAFFGYSVENDLDGIYNPKKFYNRRINSQSFAKAFYNRKKD